MTIRIDGTNTTANPGITGGDADTGLQFGTDEVSIVTGGTEQVKVDSSGRLLVGTTTPTVSKVFVAGGSLSVSGSDADFSNGGNRAFLDVGSTTARMGACHGGGSAMALDFYAGSSARVGGFSSGGVFDALATESKAGNGYVKLPSGIYLQWGVNQATTGGSTHNFPIAFPTAAWVVVGVNNNQNNPPAPQCTVVSTSQFSLTIASGSPQVNWIAIGY